MIAAFQPARPSSLILARRAAWRDGWNFTTLPQPVLAQDAFQKSSASRTSAEFDGRGEASTSFCTCGGGGGGALRSLMRSHASPLMFSVGCALQRASAAARFVARFLSTNARSFVKRACVHPVSPSVQNAMTTGFSFAHLAFDNPSICASRPSSFGSAQPSMRHAIISSLR